MSTGDKISGDVVCDKCGGTGKIADTTLYYPKQCVRCVPLPDPDPTRPGRHSNPEPNPWEDLENE